jgi:hypothetical protein
MFRVERSNTKFAASLARFAWGKVLALHLVGGQ